MSKARSCDESRFLKDVADHQMTILREDGVHRHIRFKRPSGSSYWFDLITWDETLCIDGDMGTFVFRRIHDMFEFFRADRKYLEDKGIQLAINPSYWSEKLRAPNSRHAEEYSADSFRQHVKEAFDEWVTTSQPDDEDSTESQRDQFHDDKNTLWSDLENEVLSVSDDGDVRSYDAAREFKCEQVPGFHMHDCWEWNCREYTFHFLWCCYAIAWGIKTYDEAKAPEIQHVPADDTEGGAA